MDRPKQSPRQIGDELSRLAAQSDVDRLTLLHELAAEVGRLRELIPVAAGTAGEPAWDSRSSAQWLARMAEAWPGERLRPHVKAHKCTALARRQLAAGHHTFTCATIREVEGMAAAGLGEDLLLANEVR